MLVQTTKEECELWMSDLTEYSNFDCYISGDEGYTNKQNIYGFVVMLIVTVISFVMASFFCVIFNYLKIKYYIKTKIVGQTTPGNERIELQIITNSQ
jgi:hypothetical protein